MQNRRITLHTYYRGPSKLRGRSSCFAVPVPWLKNELASDGLTIEEFLDSYTYDDAEILQRKAQAENVCFTGTPNREYN